MVNNTLSQGCLRSDNNQLDSLFSGYFSQRFYISGFNIQITGKLGSAGITWSDINLSDPGALGQFPDNGMLPGTAADDQYLYLPHPLYPPP